LGNAAGRWQAPPLAHGRRQGQEAQECGSSNHWWEKSAIVLKEKLLAVRHRDGDHFGESTPLALVPMTRAVLGTPKQKILTLLILRVHQTTI